MILESIDIFYNNRFYSSEVIEKDTYEKIKGDVEQVWGLEKDKLEFVCYDYNKYQDFVKAHQMFKVLKGKKIALGANMEEVDSIECMYIK